MNRPLIAITLGDPSGVGPEVVAKFFKKSPVAGRARFFVVGDKNVLDTAIKKLKYRLLTAASVSARPGQVPVLDLHLVDTRRLKIGQVSAQAGNAAYHYLVTAIDLALGKAADAIVTAPISKKALHLAGHYYDGHTEILAEMCGTKNYAMVLAGKKLRVLLVTTHCALKDVPGLLSVDKIAKKIQLARLMLEQLGLSSKRIAVLALNPHAGEGGLFGNEEKKIIVPAIQKAVQAGLLVDGPFPPDTAFIKSNLDKYGIFVCMYHDQGLIPFKMLEFETGVNVTVGLPIIRTSVDHGTAFDIAGKGVADYHSLEAACEMALRMVGNRAGQ